MKKIIFFLMAVIFLLHSQFTIGKTLIMGANFYNPPYLYIDGQGKFSGFEVELINAIGKLKGFNVKFESRIYPQIFEDLKSGKIHFIGNVYNSKKRKAEYLLSIPHYNDKVKFMTLARRNITNPFDGSLTVATLAFSPIEEEFQQKIMPDYPRLKMQQELTTYMGFKDLFIQKADVLMTTQTGVNILLKNYPQYHYNIWDIPQKYDQHVLISFLTTKDNAQLIKDINDGVAILKKNGVYQRLIKKYNM